MAVCSSVSISQVEYLRFDADFYHPKYLQELKTWRTLEERIGVAKLSHLISAPVRTGRTPSSRHIKEVDEIVPFIKTDGIREGRINFDSAGELPKRVLNGTDFIPADSVVITIIGATPEIVGRAAIVRNADPRCVTNQNVAVITANSKCDPYFLTAYFQTSFGRDQLWRHSRRTEQVNLNCREVERVLVPTPDVSLQNEIGDLVRASFAATDDSESLYTQAQQLLESELGLDKLRFDKPVGYTARFSDVTISNRADADFYQPPFVQLHKYLDGLHTVPLSRLVNPIKGIEVGSKAYFTQGKLFLRVSNITENGIKLGQSDKYIPDDIFKSLAESYQPKTGELLLTKDGTAGMCLVVDEVIDGIISGGIVRLAPKSDDVPLEYLALVINSKACRMQVEQECSGALILHWKPSSIRKLRIPLLPLGKMQEIVDLVIQSKQSQRESAQLLDQAKSRVEQLIEEAVRA